MHARMNKHKLKLALSHTWVCFGGWDVPKTASMRDDAWTEKTDNLAAATCVDLLTSKHHYSQ